MSRGSAMQAEQGPGWIWRRLARAASLAVELPAVIALAAPMFAAAQDYPNRPIHFVVPFAAGTATDTLARVFGQKMSTILGQPVIVDNRPGAVGIIGTDSVAKAAPDGYTLLVGTNGTNAAVRVMMKSVPFDTENDFTPISSLGVLPQVLIVNRDLPFKSLTELLNYARANPGKLTYSWISWITRAAAEMLASMNNVKFFNVPYKIGSSALADVISGQINFTIVDTIVALPQIKSGKVRALAVTTSQRVPLLAEVPTVVEAANLPGYELMGMFAAFGPAHLPPEVVAKLNAAIVTAGEDPEVRGRFANMGLKVETSTPERLRARFQAETVIWTRVATESGIEPQ